MIKKMTLKQFATAGGKARAKKYSKEKLSEWGKKGGRPRGKRRVIPRYKTKVLAS